MEITFSNIRITIEAESPKAAYEKLCEILQAGVQEGILEYETADFCTDDDPDNDRDTSELFPGEEETPAEPKTLTREEAIEKLIEERLSNWDSDDIDEALRTGRYGYEEFSNAVLEELWNDFFDEVVTITGQEPEPKVEVKKAEHDKLTEFIAQIASMKASEDFEEEDQPEYEDWVCALSNLIATARTLRKE